MKFTTNRGIMSDYLKTMIRIVPDVSPIKELCGFLIEANEDDGYVYITATNLETSIQRKVSARVEEGGSFVIGAKFCTEMLNCLGGINVSFEEIKPGRVRIKSEKCTYEMSVFESKNYPKPEIPFPEDLIPIRYFKGFYNGTHTVASSDKEMSAMNGIHFEIHPNCVTAYSCNRTCVSVVEDRTNVGKTASFTISKKAFSQLASTITDKDLLEVGFCNKDVVFIKENMIFTAKKLQYEFVDVQKLLDCLNPVYTAKVEYDDLKNEILNVFDLSIAGTEKSYIKCTFKEHEIELETENDLCSTKASVPCVLVGNPQEYTFYYSARHLKDILSTVTGTMVFRLDRRGYLLIFNRMNKYMITSLSEHAVASKEKKIKAAKSKKATSTSAAPEQKPSKRKKVA